MLLYFGLETFNAKIVKMDQFIIFAWTFYDQMQNSVFLEI